MDIRVLAVISSGIIRILRGRFVSLCSDISGCFPRLLSLLCSLFRGWISTQAVSRQSVCGRSAVVRWPTQRAQIVKSRTLERDLSCGNIYQSSSASSCNLGFVLCQGGISQVFANIRPHASYPTIISFFLLSQIIHKRFLNWSQ